MAAGSIIVDLQMRTASIETDSKRAQDSIAKLEKELRALQKSMNDTTSTYDNLERSSRRAQSGISGVSKGLQQSQAHFRASNQIMQQASYQVTDFVVQVSGGVSALRAFSQQAPQMLAAFGGTGALLGVFAALGGAIADITMKSLDIKNTADKFDDLKKAAEDVATAISMTGKVDLSSLGKNYREATKDGKALIDANITMSLIMLDMAKIDATATFRKGIQQSLEDIGFFSRAWNLLLNSAKYARGETSPTDTGQFADIMKISEDQAKAIDTAQMSLGQSKITGAEYINVLNGIFGSYEKLTPKQKEFYKNQVEYATSLQKQTDLEKSLQRAQDNNYQGLEKLTDGQKSFINALKERTEKVEKGEIAMLRMQAAEKKVLAQAEPLLALLTKQEWSREADKYSRSLELSTQALAYQNSLLGRSATEVEVLNNANKIRLDLDKQLIDMKMKLGEVDAEVSAKMRADAEATIAKQTEMIQARQEKERSASHGFQKSMDDYFNNANNMAKNVEQVFTSAFDGMSNAIVDFAMTGKESFGDFAKSVVSQIMKIYVSMALIGLARAAVGALMPTAGGMSESTQAATYGGAKPMFGYADGGYTGDGGKYQPAGVVHAGEFVMNKEATSRIGVGNLYRMMRGYADGGLVGSAPMVGGAGAGGSININVSNEAGADGYKATATARKNETGYDIDILVRKALTNDLRSNGPMTQTIGATFGLRRSA